MRAKYYKIGIRQMKREKSFALFFAILIFSSTITTLYTQKLKPVLTNFVESNANALAMNSTEQAILKVIPNISYDSIISQSKDENGKIVALCVNTREINRVSNELAIKIEDNIQENKASNIKVPLALFFDTGLLGGAEIKITIKTVPLGGTIINCYSEFDSVGINQTRHRIILEITTSYTIIAPIYLKNEKYYKQLILAETVINGEIPDSYTNLDLSKLQDTINLP